jgi:protein SERAC1
MHVCVCVCVLWGVCICLYVSFFVGLGVFTYVLGFACVSASVFRFPPMCTHAYHHPSPLYLSLVQEVQAEELLRKLRLARVGDRPVIFISHSFGGLLVKQFLLFARDNPVSRSILKNTQGVVFFSTPHRGADMSRYADTYVFRRSRALDVLQPSNDYLSRLHTRFCELAAHIPTLSFGENSNTYYETRLGRVHFQLVSDESSNPAFPSGAHSFYKLDFNHYESCKPRSQTDSRYTILLSFMLQQLRKAQEREES